MNADADPPLDEDFTLRLLACDEALAAGATPAAMDASASPELRTRLARGLACVQLLQQLRPQHPPDSQADRITKQLRAGGPAARPAGEPSDPARIGRFEICRLLGRGGFGVVYLAYDPVLRREVALKIPRADVLADAECRARFQREARAAAGLDHPHLVPVHEAGELGLVCYIALAYCPGDTLAAWLRQRTAPVGWVEAARLVAILAQAIHYAHMRGVLHRDLKPSNVMLSPVAPSEIPTPGQDGGVWVPEPGTGFLPRVTDFGLAKLDAGDGGQTRSGAILGTPAYMPPEQLDGRRRDLGPPTDVYALGAILFEVLTGRPPFWGETAMDMLWQAKTAEPVSPSQLRPQLPRDLATICLKCLHKEPRKRYSTAQALADDLDRFLAGRPILARPTSRTERALKWIQRRPGLATTLAALFLVGALGLGGILRQWQEAESQKQQAQRAQEAEARARQQSDLTLYHHRVMLAYREWSAGNVKRAVELLDECRADLRDWEWRCVRRLCDGSGLTLRGHGDEIAWVIFSPDGRRLASAAGSADGSKPVEVKLWDAATGQLLWAGAGPSGEVLNIAFSPDGRQLNSLHRTPAKDPKARTVVKSWDTATGKALGTQVGFSQGTAGAMYSPDGRRLATAGDDGRVCLWDAASGEQLFERKGHTAAASGVAFRPDGLRFASTSLDRTARIWDTASGRLLRVLSHPAPLWPMPAYSPDGRYLATVSLDRGVRIWDTVSGQVLCPYWGHTNYVTYVTFAPDGRWAASADRAGTVHVWDAQTGQEIRTIRGHTGQVHCVAFSPDGRRLATGSTDRTVRIWDVTVQQEAQILRDTVGARQLAFSPDGKLLAAAGSRYTNRSAPQDVRVWSVGDPLGVRAWKGHPAWVESVAFSPDGKLLASGSRDGSARLWDVATGRTIRVLEGGHKGAVMAVSFSPDAGGSGRGRLATAGLDRTVRLWDVASGRLLAPVLTHPHPVHDVAFSPDGRYLVSAGGGGMVLVWDADTATVVESLRGHEDLVEQARFSPDGRRLATAGWDRTVRIWDVAPERGARPVAVLRHALRGHTGSVYGLSFSRDGRRLASGCRDRTLRIWDTASGHEALTLGGHPEFVASVAFSPDGRLLVAASNDTRIWQAEDYAPEVKAHWDRAAAELALCWHDYAAQECLGASPSRWFGVAFHASRLLELRPGEPELHVRRGDAAAARARWQQAVDDYARGIELGAVRPWPWLQQTWLRLMLGDRDGYRRACAALLKRFGQTEETKLAGEIARLCALAPAAAAELEQPIRLAEKAVAAEPGTAGYRRLLAALYYRAGRFAAALQCFEEAARVDKGQGTPEDWLMLAMTHRALGQDGQARAWLGKAVKGVEATLGELLRRTDHTLAAVARASQMQLLRREAELLFAGNQAPAPSHPAQGR
jgi:WD40 repeat protein